MTVWCRCHPRALTVVAMVSLFNVQHAQKKLADMKLKCFKKKES